MHDERTNLSQQVARDVREFFKEKVFETAIPRNVRLAEAPSHGKPVLLYDVKSRGATAYVNLAREVIRRRAHANAASARDNRCRARVARARQGFRAAGNATIHP